MIDVMMIVYSVFVFLITTCIGSFLNVVIYRLPNKMNLAFPASHCPTCNHELKWYDNIPILSWLILKGKCRYCGCKITPRYLIVELLTGVISTLIFIKFGVSFTSLFGILLFLILIPISFIDIEHYIIPDVFIIILLVLGVIGIFFNDLDYGCEFNVNWSNKLIAAGAALGFGLIIILLELLLKKDLMGGGDLKLIFVSALFLGWQLLVFALGVSSLIACIFEITHKTIKDRKIKKLEETNPEIIIEQTEEEKAGLFPFGPYLAFGIMIAYMFGIQIYDWWLGLLII